MNTNTQTQKHNDLKVCMDKEVEIFFQPCGHISCCQVKVKVVKIMRLFLSGLLGEGEKVSKLQRKDYKKASSIPR